MKGAGRILALLTLPLLIWFYAETGRDLWAAWQNEEFSHGMILPIIALGWAVHLLQKQSRPPRPSPYGLWFLGLGLSLNVVGIIIANTWLSHVSLLFTLAGVTTSMLGMAALRTVLAPMGLLLFAIPLPATVYPLLTAQMQLLSSNLGVFGIRLFGLPVFQEGNVIDLGTAQLQVAEACSGLRYLFPLMTLGYLAAFCTVKPLWKRLILFLTTLPITILMNGLRIVIIGVTVDRWGQGMAEGTLHEAEGFIVFVGCALYLAGAAYMLARCAPRETITLPLLALDFSTPLWRGPIRLTTGLGLGLFVMMGLCTTCFAFLATRHLEPIPYHSALENFPMRIEEWRGNRLILDKAQLQSLKLSSYVLADYQTPDSANMVNLYVAYYASQRQGSAIHSPTICIPGAGWDIASLDQTTLGNVPQGLAVNRAVIQKGETRELVLYWFRERGQDVTSIYATKWLLMRDYIQNGRSDGSLIRLSTPILAGQSEDQAQKILTDFMVLALPVLDSYLPGKN